MEVGVVDRVITIDYDKCKGCRICELSGELLRPCRRGIIGSDQLIVSTVHLATLAASLPFACYIEDMLDPSYSLE